MTLTLNQIVKLLRLFAEDHSMISGFSAGDFTKEYKMDKTYPLMIVIPDEGSIETNFFKINLNILFLDRLKLDHSNQIEVYSDMLQLTSDLVTFIRVNNINEIIEEDSVKFRKVSDEINSDMVAGYGMELILKIPFDECLAEIPGIGELVLDDQGIIRVSNPNGYLNCEDILSCQTLTDYIADQISNIPLPTGTTSGQTYNFIDGLNTNVGITGDTVQYNLNDDIELNYLTINSGITFNGSFQVTNDFIINGNLTATTINSNLYYSGGTSLETIINNIASQYSGSTPFDCNDLTGCTIITDIQNDYLSKSLGGVVSGRTGFDGVLDLNNFVYIDSPGVSIDNTPVQIINGTLFVNNDNIELIYGDFHIQYGDMDIQLSGSYLSGGTPLTSIFADINHIHPISGITGLDSALQDRSLTGHTHQGLLPTGGTSNQVLTKVDGVDFNTTWTIPTPINYPYIEVNRVIFVSQIGTGLTPNVFYKISKVYENVNNYFIVQVDSNQQPSPVGYIHLVQDPSGNTIDFKGFVEYSPVLDRLKYDVFDCLLSQTAEDPPTMNIQSNSFYIDSSFLEYNDKGNYSIRVNQGVDITDNTKVGVYLEQKFGQIDWGNEWIVCSTKLINGSDMVYIYVLDIVAGYLSDGWLDQTPFKITIKNY